MRASVDDLGELPNLVVQLTFVQIAQRSCVSGHDRLVYDVVEVCRDRVEDAGADVRGCVIRGPVVRFTDAGAQAVDEAAQFFLVVIAHADVTTRVPRVGTVLPGASADDSQPRWRVSQPTRHACATLHHHRPQPRCRCRRPEQAATADPWGEHRGDLTPKGLLAWGLRDLRLVPGLTCGGVALGPGGRSIGSPVFPAGSGTDATDVRCSLPRWGTRLSGAVWGPSDWGPGRTTDPRLAT